MSTIQSFEDLECLKASRDIVEEHLKHFGFLYEKSKSLLNGYINYLSKAKNA